jgi:hypothetical protein
VSAQPKAISEVVKEFEQSLENLRPSTRRVYVAAAKTAIRSAHLEFWQCPSTGELLASLGESPTEKKARISPFLNFLGKELVSDEDSAALQNWVIQRLSKETRSVKNPSIATPARLDPDRRAMRGRLQKELLENGQKTCSKSRPTKCSCGTWQSRNHVSLSPCASGMPGKSAWPDRTNGGSTENLSIGG